MEGKKINLRLQALLQLRCSLNLGNKPATRSDFTYSTIRVCLTEGRGNAHGEVLHLCWEKNSYLEKRRSLKPLLCPTGSIKEQLTPFKILILAPFLSARGNPQIIINKRMQKEIVMDQVLNYVFGDLGLTPMSAGDFSGDLGLLSPCFRP